MRVRIDLNGLDTYCEEHGSGPPLVLIHGLGGSTVAWQHVTPGLAEELRVIAYDLRGLGRASTPDPPYSIEQLVGDLHALLESLALERVALLGHSLGGAVALAYAAEHPERVAALVGVAAPSVTPVEAREGVIARAELAEREGMRAVADLHAQVGFPPAFQNPANRAIYTRMVAGSDPIGYGALVRLIADLDIRDVLPRIEVPALLLAGELDQVVPAAAVRLTAASIPNCEYVELSSCGHIVPFEEPVILVECVRSFVSEPLTSAV